MNKRFGFTLSEVLITMSIIGVISALTVPTLVSNYQQKALAVKLRKVVRELVDAADMLMTEEGKTKFSATTGYSDLDTFVTTRLKTIKTCDSGSTSSCFASVNYRSISGTSASAAFACSGKSYVLADSAAICLSKDDTYKPDVAVVVDVNGQKGPNMAGRDLFMFTLDDVTGDAAEAGAASTCRSGTTGVGCFDLLVNENNWEMRY